MSRLTAEKVSSTHSCLPTFAITKFPFLKFSSSATLLLSQAGYSLPASKRGTEHTISILIFGTAQSSLHVMGGETGLLCFPKQSLHFMGKSSNS